VNFEWDQGKAEALRRPETTMTKKSKKAPELRKEYDLSALKNGVRGKYFARYESATKLNSLSNVTDLSKSNNQ
jgi:hypothetical protein